MANLSDVKNNLKQGGAAQAPATPQQANQLSLKKTLTDVLPSIKGILPKHMDVNRFMRIALVNAQNNPELMTCTPSSYIGAVVQCAELGFEPGNNLGHVYLIPYRNNKTGVSEVQFQIG